MIQIVGITESTQKDSNHYNFKENLYALFIDSFSFYMIQFKIQKQNSKFKIESQRQNLPVPKMIQIVGITESIQDNSNHYNFGENLYGLVIDSISFIQFNSKSRNRTQNLKWKVCAKTYQFQNDRDHRDNQVNSRRLKP